MIRNLLLITSLIVVVTACSKTTQSNQSKNDNTKKTVQVPAFSADSAYTYIARQVDFGPRVPNTKEHAACAEFLAAKLRLFGAEVIIQETDLTAFDGTILHAKNIIGSYNKDAESRILLFAHWDTRPWADRDADKSNYNKPILGANDGASGVGVLLEIARQLGLQNASVGVDIIFFDAEDYGATDEFASHETSDSWCLGSQYWAANKHVPGYRAKYGILLDMVGAPNAQFYREQISDMYAKYLVDKVWNRAAELGFSDYFVNKKGNGITDDHVYVNLIAGIPSINIIHCDLNSPHGFADYWHTQNDTMENIDKQTLFVVGTTLLHIVYEE